MRRRILSAIVVVVLIAVLILSVPLGVVMASRERDDAFRELERSAIRTAASLETGELSLGRAVTLPPREEGLDIAVYDASGHRIAGVGPHVAEPMVQRSGADKRTGVIADERVLALPVISDEQRDGTIRVAEPAEEANEAIRHDLMLLALIDLGSVAVAGVVGAWVASRLSRPLRLIRDDAVRLGDGDFSIEPRSFGVPELDDMASALAETASRLDAVLARERAFSSNASHQLRTPVASMRLAVETEIVAPRSQLRLVLDELLSDVGRLETTIDTLLAVARDHPRSRDPLDPNDVVRGLRRRWSSRLADAGRVMDVNLIGHPDARVNRGVLEQILDVLVTNALEHGVGQIVVTLAADGAAHLIVTVCDEGSVERTLDSLFERGDPGARGHGLGLALARSLTEAEGGRLALVSTAPTTFRVVLPDLAEDPAVR